MHNKSKFDNITEKNKNHIDSIFRTETSRDPKGVTNPLWSLDTSPQQAFSCGNGERESKTAGKLARVKSRSSFFPCSKTKQKSLLRRLMRHQNPQLFLLLRTVGYIVLALKLWPSVSITVVTWWLFFIGLPVRATLNQEIPLVHIEKRPNGGRNF